MTVRERPERCGRGGEGRTAGPDRTSRRMLGCCDGTGCTGLAGQYTVWGEVVEGMQNIDQVAPGEPPPIPDVMQRVYLESDAS